MDADQVHVGGNEDSGILRRRLEDPFVGKRLARARTDGPDDIVSIVCQRPQRRSLDTFVQQDSQLDRQGTQPIRASGGTSARYVSRSLETPTSSNSA